MCFTQKGLIFLLTLCFATNPVGAASSEYNLKRREAYLDRANQLIEEALISIDPLDFDKGGKREILAALVAKEHLEWASNRLIEELKEPRGDMFWMISVTSIAYHGRGKLSGEANQALREVWKNYMPQRGDTENHWVMYYATLYLMAQLWPELPAGEWFTGKSSLENMNEARDYLVWWIDLTTTKGQGEYDCVHYIKDFLVPLFQLASWAEDPEIRIRAVMMIDYVLADFAIDSLNGIYVGAHARSEDRNVVEPHYQVATALSWLFFNNVTPARTNWAFLVACNAPNYEVPEVLFRIATDRSVPYLSKELKRTRERWRNSDDRFSPVYKTTFVHPLYAVGSDQGGVLQPIQQHSWDLTWDVDKPEGVHNTIFSLNPHFSDYELQMYFTEYSNFMAESVNRQGKPSYTSPETFLGGSPFEEVFQEDDVIIALYNIPERATHEHVNGFFSKDLSRLEEDDSGWIFVQGGGVYIGYYPLAPYEWVDLENGGKRLLSAYPVNGTILQPSPATDWESWDAFKAAVRSKPLVIDLEDGPSVHYETLLGKRLSVTYGETPEVNGVPVDYSRWQLFDSPYLRAAPGSKKLLMRYGQLERELDFEALSVTDRVVESEENRNRLLTIHPDESAP